MIYSGEIWAMSVEYMRKLERIERNENAKAVRCKTDSRMQTCGTDLGLSVLEVL